VLDLQVEQLGTRSDQGGETGLSNVPAVLDAKTADFTAVPANGHQRCIGDISALNLQVAQRYECTVTHIGNDNPFAAEDSASQVHTERCHYLCDCFPRSKSGSGFAQRSNDRTCVAWLATVSKVPQQLARLCHGA
jgi:hypothetical protein